MFTCNVYPKHTFFPMFGGAVVEAAGLSVLIWALWSRRVSVIAGMLGLAGCGVGVRAMPGSLHATGVWPSKIAPAMSLIGFASPFGGTIALAIMGSVFNNRFPRASRQDSHSSSSLRAIAALPAEVRATVRDGARHAVVWAFISIMPIVGTCVLAAALLGNVRITRQSKRTDSGHLDSRDNVTEGVYLAEVFKVGLRCGAVRPLC